MRWEKRALGEVLKVQGGFAFKSKDFGDEGIPVVRISNLQEGTLDLDNAARIHESKIDFSKDYFLESGDVLMALSGATTGKTAVVPTVAAKSLLLNQRVGRFSTGENSKLHKQFLNHFLTAGTLKADILKAAGGVAQPNISPKQLERIQIPLPPLEEQKRIAKILDAADALRAKRRQAINQLDTFLQSTFLDLFGDPVTNPKGWEVGVIRDTMESVNYGTSKKACIEKKEYPVLRMNNITYTGRWDFTSLKYMDLEDKELPKYLVHKGQLLFNRTNSKELVGKTAVFRENNPMAFAGYLVRGIVNQRNDPEYVGAFMNMPQTKQYLQKMCKNIVGMANINAKEFQTIPIPLPLLELQQRFASIVESIEQQKSKMQAHLTQLDTLFSSLQQQAFKGEL